MMSRMCGGQGRARHRSGKGGRATVATPIVVVRRGVVRRVAVCATAVATRPERHICIV